MSTPDLRPCLRPLLVELSRRGELDALATTLGWDPDGFLFRSLNALAPRLAARAGRRLLPPQLGCSVHRIALGEAVRVAMERMGAGQRAAHAVWRWAEPRFDRIVARRLAGRAPILVGHEHACAESFRVQRHAGGLCVLRQLTVHFAADDAVEDEEAERFPEAIDAYARMRRRDRARGNDRKRSEYELADRIVVQSGFVRRTFIEAGVEAGKIVIAPPGFPEPAEQRAAPPAGPVRVLCAGHLSLRKGTLYLLEAWRRLAPDPRRAELRLAGRVLLPPAFLEPLPPGVRILGPLDPGSLEREYAAASLLVLPTVCDGLGLVVLEAMAHGIPVLTTDRAGAADFVRLAGSGWVVAARDPDALAERLAEALGDRERLAVLGEQARSFARTWNEREAARLLADLVVGAGRPAAGAGVGG